MPVGQSLWSSRCCGGEGKELQVSVGHSGRSYKCPLSRVGGVTGTHGAE